MKTNSAAVFVKLFNPFLGKRVNVKGVLHSSSRDGYVTIHPYSGAKCAMGIRLSTPTKPIHRTRATLGNVV